MRTGNSRALFWITVLGGIGGGLGGYAGVAWFILWFYGIKPEALRGHMHIAWPAWIWLIFSLVLFAISIGSSIWSLRVNLKARNLAEKRGNQVEGRMRSRSDSQPSSHG